MNFDAGLLIGFAIASVVWFIIQRRHDARVDVEVEARLLALDRERARRVFDKHELQRTGYVTRTHPALRDPEWGARPTVVDTTIDDMRAETDAAEKVDERKHR